MTYECNLDRKAPAAQRWATALAIQGDRFHKFVNLNPPRPSASEIIIEIPTHTSGGMHLHRFGKKVTGRGKVIRATRPVDAAGAALTMGMAFACALEAHHAGYVFHFVPARAWLDYFRKEPFRGAGPAREMYAKRKPELKTKHEVDAFLMLFYWSGLKEIWP